VRGFYRELGADYLDKRNIQKTTGRLAQKLADLGYKGRNRIPRKPYVIVFIRIQTWYFHDRGAKSGGEAVSASVPGRASLAGGASDAAPS